MFSLCVYMILLVTNIFVCVCVVCVVIFDDIICGIKNLETLDCCIANNVDFFGLIFYKKSPRNIEIKDAQKLIFSSKNKSISSVGVFVNEPIIQLQNLLKILKLDYIQLHGNEDKNYISEIKKKNSIKIILIFLVNFEVG